VTPKKSSGSSQLANLLRLMVLLMFGLFLALVYIFTGYDLLGLFSDTGAQPTPLVQISEPPTLLPGAAGTPVPGQVTPVGPGPSPEAPVLAGSQVMPVEQQAVPAVANWWQVFFTDPLTVNNPDNLGGSIAEKLIGYINRAQSTIHIAAFEFNLTPIADALVAAKKRGVDVRWVTDDETGLGADNDPGRGQFKQLRRAGIEVRADKRSVLMHNKFIIFDGQTVWTGSTNLTVNDNFRNNNNVIVIDSQPLAAIYEVQFNDLWNGRFGSDSPSDVDAQGLTIRSTSVQVLFSPEDDAMPYLIALVESAEKSIRFMAFSFTHEELSRAVLERAKAGVDVAGIFETRASETQYSALPPLYCAGVPVRQDGNKDTFHHKVFIVDGKIIATGSLNFSNNANENNNENTIILMNARIAQQYLKEFNRRWAEAVQPDPGDMKCR